MKIIDAFFKRPGRGPRNANGLGALVWIFTFAAAFMLISWRVMPVYSTAAKLEREEELVFILKSYKRAIMKYKTVYGSGPYKLSELVKSQPNPRFIRRLYDDPFYTGEVKIYGNANGLTPVTNPAGEIVSVISASGAISAAGIKYSKWYIDSGLKLCVE